MSRHLRIFPSLGGRTLRINLPLAARQARPLLTLLAALTLSACTSTRVEQDYLPGTDFSPYQSYDWRPGNSQVPGLDIQRLERLASSALSAQGYRQDSDDPGMHIKLSAFTRPSEGGSTGVGISFGVPLGSRGRIGVGGSQTLPSENQEEGVLVMDVSDAGTDRLIWRGTASGIALENFRMSEEPALRQTLDRLVRQFPPED